MWEPCFPGRVPGAHHASRRGDAQLRRAGRLGGWRQPVTGPAAAGEADHHAGDWQQTPHTRSRPQRAFGFLTRAATPLPAKWERNYGPPAMRLRDAAASPYAWQGHDLVRRSFEERLLARIVPRLLDAARGGALLDLGCGDGLAARLAAGRLTRYLGLDLEPSVTSSAEPSVASSEGLAHDLRDGLGPVGRRSFDLYLGSFGVASHMSPSQLERLLADIARHARPGALVALEALGLYSLEWPRLWQAPVGAQRTLPYRLGADVAVHPWAPAELFTRFDVAGITPIGAFDRTLQAGPKVGSGRYWPGLPPVRDALGALLRGESPVEGLTAPLPPLPAGTPALVHHTLAVRRHDLVRRSPLSGAALAEAIWALEPPTAGGYGHGLLVVGRVR